jgi:hypothetical protein
MRVGVSEVGYAFPAPTGIVDYELRRAGDGTPSATVVAGAGPHQARALSVDENGPSPAETWSTWVHGTHLNFWEHRPPCASRNRMSRISTSGTSAIAPVFHNCRREVYSLTSRRTSKDATTWKVSIIVIFIATPRQCRSRRSPASRRGGRLRELSAIFGAS